MTESNESPRREVDAELTAQAPESATDMVLPKQRPWALLVGLGLTAAIGGGVAYWFSTRPDPLRVLVAIDIDGQSWEGSRPAAALTDRVGKGLEKIGFDPVDGGEPNVDQVLSKEKNLVRAARSLDAGFVISGNLSPEVVEHPLEGGLVEVRTKTTLQVRYTLDERPIEVPVEAFSYGRTKEAALEQLAQTVSDRVFDTAVPAILEHEVIREKLKGDIAAQARLSKAEKYVASRAFQIKEAKERYQQLDQERAAFQATPYPITYYGDFDGDVRLGGATPEGPLFRTADVAPFLSPDEFVLAWSYRLETLVVRDASRKDTQLWAGYHILETPGVAPEGFPIVFSEDLLGFAKTLTVVTKPGESKRVVVHPESRFYNPSVSPGGRFAAVHERACRSCGRALTVFSLEDGRVVYRRASGSQGDTTDYASTDEKIGGYAWVSSDEVVYVADPRAPLTSPIDAPSEDEDEPVDPKEPVVDVLGEVRIVKVGGADPLERLVHTVGSSCIDVAASPKSGKIVVTCANAVDPLPSLILVDAKTGDTEDTGVDGDAPEFARDGARIVFETAGDLTLLELATKKLTALTKTPFQERAPRFSPDGRLVYFESRAEDPNIPRRNVSSVASIEVP